MAEEAEGLSPRNGRVDVLDGGRPFPIRSNGLLVMWGIESIPANEIEAAAHCVH